MVASIAIAGTALACLTLPNTNGGLPTMPAAPSPTPSIADIERWGRLKMPASAQHIHAYVDSGGLDALVVLTFKLPASDLPSFLAGAGYREALKPPQEDPLFSLTYLYGFHEQLPGGLDTPGLPWWPSTSDWDRMVQDPGHILLAGHDGEPSFSRTVVVDQTEGDLFTIYLVHFET